MADLHLVFTDYAQFGYSVTSPQIPGLVAAYDTMEEALQDVTRFEELLDGKDATWLHEQKVESAPNGDEYLVRFLGTEEEGPHADQRLACVGRMLASIENGQITESAWRQPTLRTGERLLLSVVPSDTLAWCLDQMDTGEGMTLEMNPHSDIVYAVPMLDKDQQPGAKSLEELGLSRDSSVQELFDKVIAAEAADIRLSVHA